jgi:hypothetical protein
MKYLLLLPLALYMISRAVYWNLIWKAPAAQFGARQ